MTFPRLTRLSLQERILKERALIAPYGHGLLSASSVAQKKSQSAAKTGQAVQTKLDATLAAHIDMLYRYSLRLTRDAQQAQDLTQEAMLRAWKKRNTLHKQDAIKSWLLRITTNLWNDQLRRKPHEPEHLVEPPASRELSATKTLLQQEAVEQALQALDALPPRQRQVLHLITIEQLSQAEVAEILSLTPQAVKASLSAGRKTLRTQLQELYDEVRGRS